MQAGELLADECLHPAYTKRMQPLEVVPSKEAEAAVAAKAPEVAVVDVTAPAAASPVLQAASIAAAEAAKVAPVDVTTVSASIPAPPAVAVAQPQEAAVPAAKAPEREAVFVRLMLVHGGSLAAPSESAQLVEMVKRLGGEVCATSP